ncbi:MAG: hypothetical protein WBB28_19995 [Crinalium sp.]
MFTNLERLITVGLTSFFMLVVLNWRVNPNFHPGVNSAIANTTSNRCEPGKTVPPNNHPADAS